MMPATPDYALWRGLLAGESLPCAAVDLDAFDRNLSALARGAGSLKIRLATKSLRVPDLLRRALDFGTPFQGLACYSAAEAAFLSSLGFDDFLVSYPTAQASDLAALADLHARGKTVSLVVDGREGLEALSHALGSTSRPFPVVLELDVSLRLAAGLRLGSRRSPLRDEASLLALAREARGFANLETAGIMAYESQVAGVPDENPFRKWRNPIVRWIRGTSIRRIALLRRDAARAWKEEALLRLFNGGGTGSLAHTSREPWLTETTAGSALLCPHLFDYYSDIRFEPACFFALQVVRSPDPDIRVCQGGGYVASGEPGWDKVPIPFLSEGLRLLADEGCGEVQTPVQGEAARRLRIGDPVLFRHAKAGELAERFDGYLLVQGGRKKGWAKTYRGLGRCFF